MALSDYQCHKCKTKFGENNGICPKCGTDNKHDADLREIEAFKDYLRRRKHDRSVDKRGDTGPGHSG